MIKKAAHERTLAVLSNEGQPSDNSTPLSPWLSQNVTLVAESKK